MRLIKLAVFVLIAFVAMPAMAASEGMAVVTLRGASETGNPTIRLSDLFSGVPDGSDKEISMAPAPGKSLAYDVNALARIARASGLSWQPQSVMDRAVVSRLATRITPDMIGKAALARVGSVAGGSGKAEAVLDNRSLTINLPSTAKADFTLDNFEYDEAARRFRAVVVAEQGQGLPQVRVPVSGRTILYREVPVLARRMMAGSVISESDIDWINLPDERAGGDFIADVGSLKGRELRRDTAEGVPLRSRDVTAPRLVTRGSLVTMRIETPNMLITAQGKAMQDGAKGDVVRVLNTQSNRTVEGVVQGPGLVGIMMVRKLAAADRAE